MIVGSYQYSSDDMVTYGDGRNVCATVTMIVMGDIGSEWCEWVRGRSNGVMEKVIMDKVVVKMVILAVGKYR